MVCFRTETVVIKYPKQMAEVRPWWLWALLSAPPLKRTNWHCKLGTFLDNGGYLTKKFLMDLVKKVYWFSLLHDFLLAFWFPPFLKTNTFWNINYFGNGGQENTFCTWCQSVVIYFIKLKEKLTLHKLKLSIWVTYLNQCPWKITHNRFWRKRKTLPSSLVL